MEFIKVSRVATGHCLVECFSETTAGQHLSHMSGIRNHAVVPEVDRLVELIFGIVVKQFLICFHPARCSTHLELLHHVSLLHARMEGQAVLRADCGKFASRQAHEFF